jgi:hypothetical protein
MYPAHFSPMVVTLTSPDPFYHVRSIAVISPLAAFVSCEAQAALLPSYSIGSKFPGGNARCVLFRPQFASSELSVKRSRKNCPRLCLRYLLGRLYE